MEIFLNILSTKKINTLAPTSECRCIEKLMALRDITFYFKQKELLRTKAFLGRLKKFVRYGEKSDNPQIDVLTKACKEYKAIGFYIFYIKTRSPHEPFLSDRCEKHKSDPFNSTLKVISLEDIEREEYFKNYTNENDFKNFLIERSVNFICMLAGCFNPNDSSRESAYNNFEYFLKNFNLSGSPTSELLDGGVVELRNKHIVERDYASPENVELIITHLKDKELITFSTLAGLIGRYDKSEEQKKRSQATSNLVLRPSVTPAIAAKVILNKVGDNLNQISESSSAQEKYKIISDLDKNFKSSQTSKKRSEILDINIENLNKYYIIDYETMKQRLHSNGIEYRRYTK